ncbi:MAG: phosphoribosylformylglycinamidine synthase subunit PurS [Polyangiaceae bacterium]|nr:phosphoribosylformylglycinamidine synthase subunit PurS [Polyangiaceae bacterium]
MKATVVVRLKPEVLDPQGDAVRRALGTMGFQGVRDVRIGRIIEIEIDDALLAGASPEEARARLTKMADELFANPVIEDYEVRAG